jgi:hypothetical protein
MRSPARWTRATATWNSLASITAFDKFNPYYVQPAFVPNTRRWAAPIDIAQDGQNSSSTRASATSHRPSTRPPATVATLSP